MRLRWSPFAYFVCEGVITQSFFLPLQPRSHPPHTLSTDLPPNLHNGASTHARQQAACTHQSFSGENLEQFEKESSIPEIRVEILDAAIDAAQVYIDPFGERLLLHVLTLN